MKKQVLGVKIDDVNMDQALEIVENWLKREDPASPAKRGEKHYIVTPNPEIVMMAQEDDELKKVLNNADLSIPDGVGLKLSGEIECITPGMDFMEVLIKMAEDLGLTIGLLGGRGEAANRTAERLRKKYKKLKIVFAESGGEVDNNGDVNGIVTLPSVAHNDGGGIDILFVAFGPPKQEKWINKNLPNLHVKVAMAVGGAFDFLSGKVPRAPKWLTDLGLEWLFRLVIQPWRIKRQVALLKYVWLLRFPLSLASRNERE